MKIEFITVEKLTEIKNEIVKELTTLSQNQAPKKWLRSKEIRELLNISPGTLQNMRINKTLPYSKLGSTFFYDYDLINEILNEKKQ